MRTSQRTCSTVVAERTFPCTPDQVGPARRWAASVYAEAGEDPDTCRLLVSEMATNAVMHTESSEFRVRVHPTELWVEVCDQSWETPHRRPTTERLDDGTSEPSEHGRGLELLEMLAPGYEILLRDGEKGVRFRPLPQDV